VTGHGSTHGAALALLAEADAALRGVVPRLGSLAPGRDEATSLVEIGEELLRAEVSVSAGLAFARALSRVMRTQAETFPGTLFWDAELPAVLLLGGITADERSGTGITLAIVDAVCALEHEFGHHTTIQFRYSHDFAYGFDWARWVRKDPAARSGVGPFGAEFLHHQRRRGRELEALIATDDAKYPKLPRGVDRNPFGFSRSPEDEARLFRDLAERGLVPLEAWRFDAVPRWDLPFAELREERARELGLFGG
jgi:hypothetical protein